MYILFQKFKEVIFSILPITFIVLIIHFIFVPLESDELIRFFLGTIFIIIGLTLFLFGVDIGITPIGDHIGTQIAKSNKLYLVIIIGLILGFFISIAEPGLIIYGQQVAFITGGMLSSWQLLLIVSLGIAIFLSIAFIRIIYNIPLYKLLTVLYIIIFILAIFTDPTYLIFAFDASGSTTGVLAVPFMFALALGISHLKKDTKASEKDSFGTIAIVSVGAIMAVLIMGIINEPLGDITTNFTPGDVTSNGIWHYYGDIILPTIIESLLALTPLLVIFLIFNFIKLKLNMKLFFRIIKGLIYALFGLIIFLIGANGGFMFVGQKIGTHMIGDYQPLTVVIIAFLLGIFTVLAEPAVHVLTQQIENVTSGYITKKIILIFLSFGIGLALALSVLKIFILELELWHLLLPGYIIALILSYFVPKMFVGIAFDAGGVATGPMTATFILAFIQGAAQSYPNAHPILDGLGMIALVALMPIITLQVLGLIFKIKTRKAGTADVT